MEIIKFSINNGNKNMQIDSDLLDNAIKNKKSEPVFRLYGWSPMCISLGRNQKDNFLKNNKYNNIDCVRRITGGRALLHDNEITYSYVTPISAIPHGDSVTDSYKYISGILINFFKTLGIELDFGENKKLSTNYDYCMLLSTGADVCCNGKKIIGSAQCRKEGYILQHGSILFGYNKNLLENLFGEEIVGITTVKEILPDIDKNLFIHKLENYIINYSAKDNL